MKKTYKIAPDRNQENQFLLYLNDRLILTGNEHDVWRSFQRRINSTVSAIRQHGGEPLVERWTDEDAHLVQVTWAESPKGELRCLELPTDSWKSLEDLAENTASFAKSGPHTGQSSWRTLIRRIADGELKILREEKDAEDL
jgi:hypothetical protein